MDDMISRQAAIDAIRDRYYKYDRFAKIEELVWAIDALPSVQPTCTNTVQVDDCISREAAIKTAHLPVIDDAGYEVVRVNDILALPPAQPGWIPCNSEHLEDYELPKQHERVLVSFVDRRNRKHPEKPVIRIGINSVEKNYGKPFWRYGNGFSVVAWMPLPTPYREGGQDETD